VSLDIVYFSNYSGNTKRFVEKLTNDARRIPIDYTADTSDVLVIDNPFVLVVPTYGGGNAKTAIPRQVRSFLNIPENRELLRGVIGTGNTNFGEHYCKAAELISAKTGVPLIARVEIFGTPEDIDKITERLEMLNDTTV
jgi:protein involved in ribonucleotide reduction